MGLKQSIVIKNEFTCKTAKGGTRGATLGNYVIEYMSRGGATEAMTPVRLNDQQNYILNYMLREEATESAESVSEIKQDFRDLQKLGGKSFGYGSVSLSDASLREAANDVQKNFLSGKTILKTVISFDEAYLRENGIINPDFQFRNIGDYRGNIDQLKLRMSIMNGLEKVSRYYDDLQYVGAIQVDTAHVHCHLAMFDRGRGTMMPDGTQRGKMTGRMMRDLRRGIDMYLDEKQTVKMMTSSVQYNKQNTIGYIKRFTHETMNNRGLAQFMIACLPEDRSMWRAGSNASEMRKANSVVREYVEQVLAQPDSGYKEAMQKVTEYAGYRQSHEDLTGEHYRELINSKRERIITDSMNAVYSVLKQIPEEELSTQTPLMDVMSMPYEEAVNRATSNPDSIEEFGFRLRSYKARLDHHTGECKKYHNLCRNYEQQMKRENPDERPSEASRAAYRFYQTEEEYNEMLMNKYQYFLDFIPPDEIYMQDFRELEDYGKQIVSLQRMLADTSMHRMLPVTAEQYGRRVYNTQDGRLMVTDPDRLSDRLTEMKQKYDVMRDNYNTDVMAYGFHLTDDDTLTRDHKYPFDDVKSLDLHHMTYDFPYDFTIPLSQSQTFINMADRRFEAFEGMKTYLTATGQADYVRNLPESDIMRQHEFADRFRVKDTGFAAVRENESEKRHPSRTIRLDYDFYTHQEEDLKENIKVIVENTVSALQYE